jgi:helicase
MSFGCATGSEFTAERPSRFLPYPAQGSFGGLAFWSSRNVPIPLDRANEWLLQGSYALALYVTGLPERKITFSTGLSAGMVQRFAYDVAWILDGLHRISIVPDLGISQGVSNQIAQLARRVRWGAPVETLDILRTAEKHGVPGLGRQRAMELVQRGWSTFKSIIGARPSDLLEVLKDSVRVEAFVQSMESSGDTTSETLKSAHIRIAGSLGFEEVMERCYSENGTEYEKAIFELLSQHTGLTVTMVDDGKRQNVPDLSSELAIWRLWSSVKLQLKSKDWSPKRTRGRSYKKQQISQHIREGSHWESCAGSNSRISMFNGYLPTCMYLVA